jgi:hypothetical protein
MQAQFMGKVLPWALLEEGPAQSKVEQMTQFQ